jgi:hypothetical protein
MAKEVLNVAYSIVPPTATDKELGTVPMSWLLKILSRGRTGSATMKISTE